MTSLRSKVIRLAHAKPELRPHLLPLLKQSAEEGLLAGRRWDGSKANPDDSNPYKDRSEDIDVKGGTNGSEARRKYNCKYRQKVCPKHGTKCGDKDRDWAATVCD